MFKRNCPFCNKKIFYTNKYTRNRAEKLNQQCAKICPALKIIRKTKVCNKCNKRKQLNKFYIMKNGKYGRAPQCNKCLAERAKVYRNSRRGYEKRKEYVEKNRERENKKARERYRNPSVKMAKAEYRKTHKLQQKRYDKVYRKIHKNKILEKNRKRRDIEKLMKSVSYSLNDELITRKAFKNICANCKNKNNLTIDHHLPLSKGNPLSIKNAVLLCKSCNSSKGAKRPKDFYNAKTLKKIERILNKIKKKYR